MCSSDLSHGIGVGSGLEFNIPETKAAYFNLATGYTSYDEGSDLPFFAIEPTGINESQQVSETAVTLLNETGLGSVAMITANGAGIGLILPPGVIGDVTVGINSAGIIGGNSEGLPVLWVPNP